MCRLWDPEWLRPWREPDIARVNLASPLLDICAWGADIDTLAWFDAPPAAAVSGAVAVLERLGALERGRLTARGRQLQALPVHPRLAMVLLTAQGAPEAPPSAPCSRNVICSRRGMRRPLDLLAVVDRWHEAPWYVRQVARVLEDRSRRELGTNAGDLHRERELRRAIFAGYPDRLAQRRQPNGDRVSWPLGAGATLAPKCGVRGGEWLVALEIQAVSGGHPAPDARIRLASLVDEEWITPTGIERVHLFDEASGRVRALRRTRYGALTLSEQHDSGPRRAGAALG